MEIILNSMWLTVDYKFTRGREGGYSSSFGNFLPPEHPEVELKHVWLENDDPKNPKKIDILEVLPEDDLEFIRSEILDEELS